MDRDNPFASSYLREGATRVQKPRLTYRQTDTAMPVANNAGNGHINHPVGLVGPVGPVAAKRSSPHLRLQRRLSLTSDTSNRPAIANDDESEADFMVPTQNRNNARRNSAAMSIRSNGSTATRRNSNRSRVVRPADHSRPTVHFSSGRSEVLLTLPAPHPSQAHSNMLSAQLPQLPTAPTSTALSRPPNNRSSAPVFGTNNHFARQPMYDSVYGSTAGSISTNHHSASNNTKKTVTFDSSETEDSMSCLSNSTQATSVDERDHYGYYDYLPGEKTTAAPPTATITVDYPQRAPPPPSVMSSSTATMSPPTRPQFTRRRSQSFSGSVDHELLRTDSGLVHLPTRRSLRDSYSHIPADTIEDAPAPASISSSSSHDNGSDKNTQAQFEAHKVALEAQFEQRQQALETDRKKLAVELEEVVTALGEAQAERNDLRREAAEHRQRIKALVEEVDDLRENMDKSLQLKTTETQEQQELRADLESNKVALDETRAALAQANQTLADANTSLTQVQESLRDEEATSALFREGKVAFEERCGDLEAKCTDLEGKVVAARDANKELHLLMAAQIEDLSATKDALQVRIGVLEEEEASRVAAAAAAVATAKAAEEQAAEAAKTFTEDNLALEEKLAAAETKCASIEVEKEAADTEVKDLKEQIENLGADVAAKTAKLESLTTELEKAKEENAAHQETITAHEAAVDNARQEAEEAATTAATEASGALKATIAKLEEAHAALTTECETLKASVAAAGETSGDGGGGEAAVPDTELQEKYSSIEAAHTELQEKLTALEATLATEKETAVATLTTAQTEAAIALAAAQEAATAAKAEAATHAAQLPELTQQNVHLANELAAHSERVQELRAAYATSEAEGMALRDQLAKMRAKLAGVAGSVASNGSSASKKGSKKTNKDEMVIVRTPGDRGRFQVMRKSDLHRSPSRSSRKTDYDSA